ncbi:MAG: leucyl aminopeptidase family protein [Aminivibrio sp.]|jgi:leucyl aminopeptidase
MHVKKYSVGVKADLFCIFTFEGETPPSPALPEAEAVIARLLSMPGDGGEKGSRRTAPLPGKEAGALMLAGLGKRPDKASAKISAYRNQTAECVRFAASLGYSSVIAQLPEEPDQAASRASAEGAVLGGYLFDRHKTLERGAPRTEPEAFMLCEGDEDAMKRGALAAEAQTFSRDLANEPGNVVTPTTFAEIAQRTAEEFGLECKILDETGMADLGMNALLAVGQGSKNPPRLVHLVYRPDEEPRARVALVGKTVTFDSGGLCIKTRDGIKGMKTDKTGGCNVLAIMRALGQIRPPVEVHGIMGAVENMPDGGAFRPDDIIKTMSGKTIEILNTDAEGRLTLADLLTYACRTAPDSLIDMATLTGAAVWALGNYTAALVSDHDGLSAQISEAAERAGERFHRFAMDDEKLREQIKSEVADFTNSGGPGGGVITAGMLLREFVDPVVPWAHLDIAAVARYDKEFDCYGKGASAFGTRACLEYILSI